MTSTILVGVDGSAPASRAAHTAARLADALAARLVIASAFTHNPVELVEAGSDRFVHTGEKAALDAAGHEAGVLRGEYPGLQVEVRASAGKPADMLVTLATELDAEIIVVGNKRVQGLARVLGSIAADVAHRAPCDVYIAHTHQGVRR